jgi:hypothetical protein
MLDDFRKMLGPWEQKILDLNEQIDIRNAIALDLGAADEALSEYLATHTDRTGPIDSEAISVTLPEGSPLRTDTVTKMTFKELVTHYKGEHEELGLPDFPSSADGLEFYQKALRKAVDMTNLPAAKGDSLALNVALTRRYEILDAMKLLADKICALMTEMLRR